MTDKTPSDVDRALAAFGSGAIKYRSFGAPSLRPTTPRPANVAAVRPVISDETDPFSAPPVPRSSEAEPTAAAKLFPLLGAAVPEASTVRVQENARAGTAAAESFNDNDFRYSDNPSSQSGVDIPAPPAAYATPADDAADYGDPNYPPPETRRAPPPETPYYAPSASYAPAPSAPAPYVPPAPYLQPAPAPMNEASTIRPSDPPAWALAQPEPPPVAAQAHSAPIPPARAPQPDPAYRADVTRPPPRAAEPPPITTLAAHYTQSGVGPAGAAMDSADRRSLAEMFRVLADRAAAQPPQAALLTGGRNEEPGLFRRL